MKKIIWPSIALITVASILYLMDVLHDNNQDRLWDSLVYFCGGAPLQTTIKPQIFTTYYEFECVNVLEAGEEVRI